MERRKHKRLPVKVGILCRKVGVLHNHVFTGSTVDISPDGVLAKSIEKAHMDTGDLFNVELDLPDNDNVNQFGGKVSAYARVVRIVDPQEESRTNHKHIAFQFCSRPQFDI